MVRITTEARSSLKNISILAATSLLLRNISYHPSTDQDMWIKTQQKAMRFEVGFAQKAMRKFTNVQAEYVQISAWILVKIRFDTLEAAQDINKQFVLDNLTQKYTVKGPTGPILAPEKAQDYPTRTGTTTGLTGAVVTYDIHANCAVQLRLLQRTPERDILLSHKQVINGVDLVPESLDMTAEESDIAYMRLARVFEKEEIHNLFSIFSEALELASGFSARNILLAGELPLVENIYDDGTKWECRLEHPEMLRQRAELRCWNRLDQWQTNSD